MALNKDVPVQLHYQLTNELRDYIKLGHWSIGDMFPPDREIMEKYKVSATTVRRAVKQLVEEDWLERTPGKGTFIKKEPIREELGRLTGFFEEMRAKGLVPSAEILSAGSVRITADLLKKSPELQNWPQQEAILFQKLHKFNDKPIVYVNSYWKQTYGLELKKYDLSVYGLYEAAAKYLGVNLTRADQIISAGVATKQEVECLQIKRNEPVLIMERLAYAGDELVELSRNVYRADRYNYHVILHNDQPSGEMVLKS